MKSAIEMRRIATDAIKENLTSNQLTQLNLVQERINKEALEGKLSCHISKNDELYEVLCDFFIRNLLISLEYKIQIEEIFDFECESIRHISIIW